MRLFFFMVYVLRLLLDVIADVFCVVRTIYIPGKDMAVVVGCDFEFYCQAVFCHERADGHGGVFFFHCCWCLRCPWLGKTMRVFAAARTALTKPIAVAKQVFHSTTSYPSANGCQVIPFQWKERKFCGDSGVRKRKVCHPGLSQQWRA